jgi:Glu-tRNA(Gln) amidotransferase subunit E-like FAD-binding protein
LDCSLQLSRAFEGFDSPLWHLTADVCDASDTVDVAAVEEMVERVLAANPQQLAQYCSGKTKLAGFFTGQVMKESQGRVNPGLMNQVLMKKLQAAADAAAAGKQ